MPNFAKAVDTADNTTDVSAGPAILKGIYVNTALSAHAVVVKDGTTALFTLPASTVAGTYIDLRDGVIFKSKIVCDPDDSSTGNVTFIYGIA